MIQKIEKEILEMLACPACRAAVSQAEVDGNSELVCAGCARRYPIQDGILVMLVEEARGGPATGDPGAATSRERSS